MREYKFRAWMDEEKYMVYFDLFNKPPNVFSSDFIMQYTGLKDKNGEEIYKEDIVKKDKYIGRVYQADSGLWMVRWTFKDEDNKERSFLEELLPSPKFGPTDIEVIGNTYES